MKIRRSIRSVIVSAVFLGSPVGLALMGVLFRCGVPAGLSILLAYTASTAGAVALLRK